MLKKDRYWNGQIKRNQKLAGDENKGRTNFCLLSEESAGRRAAIRSDKRLF